MIIDRAESLKNSSWKCGCSTSYQARHFSSGSPLFYRNLVKSVSLRPRLPVITAVPLLTPHWWILATID